MNGDAPRPPLPQPPDVCDDPQMRLPLALVLVLAGCTDKDDAESEGAVTTSTSTTDVTTAGDSASSTSAATEGSSSTTTSGDPATTGELECADPPDQIASCDRFCGRLEACDLDGAFDGCPCVGFDGVNDCCDAGWGAVADCFDALTCAEIEDEARNRCWALYVTTIEVCIGDEQRCLHTFSPPDESPCYEQDECTDAPVERIECADGICVCTMDGGEVGSCAGECDGWGTPLSFAACCPDPTL